MVTAPIKIGLLWHSAGSGNLGVGALTIANMAIARDVATDMGLTPEFRIIGMRDGDRSYLTAGEAEITVVDGRSLLSPTGCWKTLGEQDCVLDIGAGDSFADIYGAKRFTYLWLTKLITLLRRTPLLLSPQTIGPFNKPLYRALAAYVMKRAVAIIARDRLSLQALREMAPAANGVLAVDVAFALPYTDGSSQRSATRPRIGVNVSGLLFHEAETGSNRFGLDIDYAKLTRDFLRDLTSRSDLEVHLVTHATSSTIAYDDDARIADRLAAEYPTAIRVADFPGPCEAKSYISGLDFLVAGRMHACIAAFSSGTPVVPIAYSRKFSGLFGMLGYPWLVPVKGASTEEALAYLHNALEHRGELERATAEGMTKVAALLDAYRVQLKALFATAVETLQAPPPATRLTVAGTYRSRIPDGD